jgi:hypothetical protein
MDTVLHESGMRKTKSVANALELEMQILNNGSGKDVEKGASGLDDFGEDKEWKQREMENLSSNSLNRRMLLMCSYMLVMSTLFGSLVGFVGPIFVCFVWAIAALFCHLFLLYHPTENLLLRAFVRAVMIAVMLTAVLLYHLGTHKTIHLMERELWDSTLLHLDRTILGGFFPEGQLALWADGSTWIGPDSFLGRSITEVLQLLYFSYYIWGNALVIYMGLDYFYACFKNGWRHDKGRWRKIQMLLLCFVGTYLLNYSVNFIFPAVSPRIYLADRYQNELRGFWVGDLMRYVAQTLPLFFAPLSVLKKELSYLPVLLLLLTSLAGLFVTTETPSRRVPPTRTEPSRRATSPSRGCPPAPPPSWAIASPAGSARYGSSPWSSSSTLHCRQCRLFHFAHDRIFSSSHFFPSPPVALFWHVRKQQRTHKLGIT